MSISYFIRYKEPCPECDGQGVITDPLWLEANEKFIKPWDKLHGPVWSDEKTRAFDAWWADTFFGNPDSEPGEFQCDYCNGTGVHEGEISLLDALIDLGFCQPKEMPCYSAKK